MTEYAYFGLELLGGVKQNTIIGVNSEIYDSGYDFLYIKPSIGFGDVWVFNFIMIKIFQV